MLSVRGRGRRRHRARGQRDRLGAVRRGQGGGSGASCAASGAAGRLAIALDVEPVGVLEHRGVAGNLDDKAVHSLVTESRADLPLITESRVLDTSCEKVSRTFQTLAA